MKNFKYLLTEYIKDVPRNRINNVDDGQSMEPLTLDDVEKALQLPGRANCGRPILFHVKIVCFHTHLNSLSDAPSIRNLAHVKHVILNMFKTTQKHNYGMRDVENVTLVSNPSLNGR